MQVMNPPEITVNVRPQYLPEQSDPDNQQYAFAYTVTIHLRFSESINTNKENPFHQRSGGPVSSAFQKLETR